jgi:hypothetical protein
MASRSSQVSVTQAEIYADRNPLRSGRRKRTKKSTAAVRHLRLDLDTDREARLTALYLHRCHQKPKAVAKVAAARKLAVRTVLDATHAKAISRRCSHREQPEGAPGR